MSTPPEAFPGGVPQPGTRVGQKYRVERLLGAGGMGIVLAATHVYLGERVALKLVRPALGVRAEAYERLLREARIASRIRSEHVARVFDLGTLDDGLPYIAMEFLEGEDLMTRLQASGAMPVDEAVEFLLQAAEGVAEAHGVGVVHRDLKPANLFVTRRSDGSPCIKVLDFGISKIAGELGEIEENGSAPGTKAESVEQTAPDSAPGAAAPGWMLAAPERERPLAQLTRSRARIGSPRYMAPEQFRSSRDVDARVDVWALGAILHELLAGAPPFEGDTFDEVVEAVTSHEPPAIDSLRPDVPRALAEVVERCLRKTREARFATVADVALALAPFAPHGTERAARIERILTLARAAPSSVVPSGPEFDPTLAATSGTPQPKSSRRDRRPWKRAAVALGAASAVALAALVVGRRVAERRAPVATVPSNRAALVAVFPPSDPGADATGWLATALAELVAGDLATSEKVRPVGTDRVAQVARDIGHALDTAPRPEEASRLRAMTGADYAVTGSIARRDKSGDDRVRVDLALVEAASGRVLARRTVSGSTGAFLELVASISDGVREELGVPGATPAERRAARASLPTNPEAVRAYAEGIAYRRARLPAKAREALTRAVAAEPEQAVAHAELAAALITLGRDAEARAEAARALDLSGSLPRERQLTIQEQLSVATKDWSHAADLLRTLHGFFPDDLTYGLQYARTTMAAGHPQEGLAILDTLRDPTSPNAGSPDIDLMEAVIALKVSDFHRAIDAAERAQRKAEADGERTIGAEAALHEGDAYSFLGDSARALALCQKAASAYLALADESRRAGALRCEAHAYEAGRQWDLAARATEEALEAARQAGDAYLLGGALNSDGIRLYEAGDRAAARARWEEAAKVYEDIHDREGVGHAEGNIATALLDDGNLAAAREGFQRGLALHREVASVAGQRNEIRGLADVDAAAGDLTAAESEYAEAEKLTEQMGNREELATAWIARARLLRDRGDDGGARSLAERAQAALKELGNHDDAAEAAWLLAKIALDARRNAEAEGLARQALAEVDASTRRGQAGPVLALLARATAEAGRFDEARSFADRVSRELGSAPPVLLATYTAIDVARARARMFARGLSDLGSQEGALAALAARAAALGLRGCELEARLAAVAIGQGDAAALAREARKAGYLRIARRAAATTF